MCQQRNIRLCLLPASVAAVLVLTGENAATINIGTDNGLRQGMDLYDRNMAVPCELEVVSCGPNRAAVRKKYAFEHEALHLGDHLSTRLFGAVNTAQVGPVRFTHPPAPPHAIQRVKLDPGPTDYRWVSPHDVIFFRYAKEPPYNRSTLVTYNLLTRTEQPLQPLSARVGYGEGGFEQAKVSPDGRSILWMGPDEHGVYTNLLYSLDGTTEQLPAALRQRRIDDMYWMGSGRRLLVLEDRVEPARHAATVDLDKPEQTHEVVLPSGTELPFNSFGDARICVTPTDDLLYAAWDAEQHGAITPSVRINQIHPGNASSAPRAYTVHLPAEARLYQIALSPTGEKVVWELAFARQGKRTVELWLSDRDGSHMHAIEHVALFADDFPDLKVSSHDIHWSPDGKQIGFVYDYALWTVPAD